MKNAFIHNLKSIGQGLPFWAQVIVRIPFLFLFARQTFLFGHERCLKNPPNPCRSVSIVIPTLNEEKNILACIQSLSGNHYVKEIIVVDGGSTDRTRVLARQAETHVIIHDKPIENGGGRGGQIKAGIHAATGDVVAIVHADVRLPGFEIDRMMRVVNCQPTVIGGAIGCRFDSPDFRFRLIELANDARAAFLGLSFGDQVQFFRRAPVVQADLFPGIALMEDVEFSIRLRRLGRCVYLFGSALAATRRWERMGFWNTLWVFQHVLVYLMRRLWKTPETAWLYQKYYVDFRG